MNLQKRYDLEVARDSFSVQRKDGVALYHAS